MRRKTGPHYISTLGLNEDKVEERDNDLKFGDGERGMSSAATNAEKKTGGVNEGWRGGAKSRLLPCSLRHLQKLRKHE